MIKKQTLTILLCGGVFVLLLLAWLILPDLLAEEEVTEEPPTLLPGEVLSADNSIYLFPYIQRADIDRVEVHNEYGTFAFCRDEDDSFYIEGKETSSYDSTLFSTFIVSAGMTRSLRRIDDALDLHEYGLAPEDDPAYYILTTVSGQEHKVYIGDMLPTEGGYYCRYEGRDAVYVLDTTVGESFLNPVYYFLSPLLGPPMSTSDVYSVDDLTILRDGEIFLWLDTLAPAENGTDKTDDPKYTYEFVEPANYTPNLQQYSTLLDSLISLSGSQVVAAGDDLTDDPAAFLEENYGIRFDKEGLSDAYFVLSLTFEGDPYYIYFSEPDEEGDLYAFSSLYWHVVELNISSASFLTWELIDYIDPPLFSDYLYNVETIEIEGQLPEEDGTLTVDAVFHIDADSKNQTVNSVRVGDSEAFDDDEMKNFRQFYTVLLLLRLQDYADRTDIESMTYLATMRVTRKGGEPIEYVFYGYNTRRCYYTVNGEGEFYVPRDHVEKLLRDTDRLLNGLPVDATARS